MPFLGLFKAEGRFCTAEYIPHFSPDCMPPFAITAASDTTRVSNATKVMIGLHI